MGNRSTQRHRQSSRKSGCKKRKKKAKTRKNVCVPVVYDYNVSAVGYCYTQRDRQSVCSSGYKMSKKKGKKWKNVYVVYDYSLVLEGFLQILKAGFIIVAYFAIVVALVSLARLFCVTYLQRADMIN